MFIVFGDKTLNTDQIVYSIDRNRNGEITTQYSLSNGEFFYLNESERNYLNTQLGTSRNTGYIPPA